MLTQSQTVVMYCLINLNNWWNSTFRSGKSRLQGFFGRRLDILAFPATFVSNDVFGAETLPSVGERNPIFVSGDRPDGIKKKSIRVSLVGCSVHVDSALSK